MIQYRRVLSRPAVALGNFLPALASSPRSPCGQRAPSTLNTGVHVRVRFLIFVLASSLRGVCWMVTKRACCGWGSLGGLGWTGAGLGWVGWGLFDGKEFFWAKTKDETDKTDWTEGIEASSGKQPFPPPSPKRQLQLLFSQLFSTTFHFLRLRLFFFFLFFSLPLSHFVLLF